MLVHDKVALVTGGVSGIGASCVEELLKNSVKAVVIADLNSNEEFVEKLNKKYGDGKVFFVRTDISNEESFDNAFQKTIEEYGNIDILVNCAGKFDEGSWQKLIQINLVGTLFGSLLAINKYFPNHKSTSEAYIVNIASVAGLSPFGFCPGYAASKHGIVGWSRSMGINELVTAQGVYIMAVCPGVTDTPLVKEADKAAFNSNASINLADMPFQKPEDVARAVVQVLEKAEAGSVWVIDDGVLSKVELPLYNNLKDVLVNT